MASKQYPRPAVGSKKPLTEMQKKFAKLVGTGMGQTHAADKAGFAHAKQASVRLAKDPRIQLAIAKEREAYAKASGMTKKKVIDGIVEAIDMARMKADPTAMIQGYREVGRMCGFYEPTKHQVNVSVNGQVMLQQMQAMTDEELLQLAEERGDQLAIEGEFEEVPPSSEDDEAEDDV